jgi:hypothetical protein
MTVRKYSSVSIDTTLAAGGISDTATSMTVATGTGTTLMGGITLTAGDIFTVAIDPDTVNEEVVYITARSSDTFTIDRAEAGTAGVVHSAGATVRHVLSSDDLNYFNQAIQSTTAPGFTPTISGGSASTISTQIQVRRDTAANWTSTNPTLTAGEFGFETDTGKFKIGTGSAVWTSLAYSNADASTVTLTGTQTLTNKTLTAPKINLAFNAQTGTTYTLVAADSGKLVTSSNASAVVITIPPSVFAAGEQINVQSIGVGLTSFVAGAGVTVTSTGATASAPILRAQFSACTIICTSSDNFTVIGDII